MRIGGIVDISTKDIPHGSTMVIFTVGCNFNCKFCQNKYLLQKKVGKSVQISELIKNIKSNKLVGSVSISGGEPTLQEDLIELCALIQKEGKYVSVDTNGSRPRVIKELLPHVNRIALDLKASPSNLRKYGIYANVPIDPTKIIDTFRIVNSESKIDFEMRTTYVENLMTPDDIHEILTFLIENEFKGNYVLQQYQYSDGVGEEYKDSFQKPTHGAMLDILRRYNDSDLSFKIFIRNDVVGYEELGKILKKLEEY